MSCFCWGAAFLRTDTFSFWHETPEIYSQFYALIFQDFVHVYIYTCIHMHTHIIKVGSPSYKLVYKPHEYYSNILHWFRRSLPKFDGCWMCFTHSVGHNSPSVVKLRFKDLSIDEEDWNGCFLMDYNRWHSMVDVPAVPACQVWWHRKGKMYVFKSCTHSKTKEDPRILWNPPIASKNVLVCWVEKKRTYVMPKHHHTHGEPQPDAGPKVGIPCSFAGDREWQISWDIQLFFSNPVDIIFFSSVYRYPPFPPVDLASIFLLIGLKGKL